MNADTVSVWRAERRFLTTVTLVYVLVNALMMLFSVPTISLVEADALTLYRMALQFLNEGAFLEEQRQPLYPLLAAMTFRLFGPETLWPLVVLQVGMLFVTAIYAWRIANEWLPRAAHWVFALTLLNPNALGNAHVPLADTLYAMLTTIAVWHLLRFARGCGFWSVVPAVGIAMGLAALTRPETKFLLYILPLAFAVMALISGQAFRVWKALLAGVAALAIAWAVALPWILHNQAAGHGLTLTAGLKAADNARGHFALVEAARQNRDRIEIAAEIYQDEAELIREAGLAAAAPREIRQFLFGHYIRQIFGSDPLILAQLYTKAWIGQFASGGAQTINMTLGIGVSTEDKLMTDGDGLARFVDGLARQSGLGAVITFSGVLFAIVLRLAGLCGLVVMAARRHWPLLAIILALVAFKAAIHLFYGISRYRLPVEPLLMMLAVYGFHGLRAVIAWRR